MWKEKEQKRKENAATSGFLRIWTISKEMKHKPSISAKCCLKINFKKTNLSICVLMIVFPNQKISKSFQSKTLNQNVPVSLSFYVAFFYYFYFILLPNNYYRDNMFAALKLFFVLVFCLFVFFIPTVIATVHLKMFPHRVSRGDVLSGRWGHCWEEASGCCL